MAEGPNPASVLQNRLINPDWLWDYESEFTAQQTDTIVHAATGIQLCITDIYINVKGVVDVTLHEPGGIIKWKYYGTASGNGVCARLRCPIILSPSKPLLLDSSAAVTFFIAVSGYTKQGE